MSDLVCLQCGKDMEYDWAPCPHCGWKVPGPWEESAEQYPTADKPLMSKSSPWIQWTALVLLALALIGLFIWLFHFGSRDLLNTCPTRVPVVDKLIHA